MVEVRDLCEKAPDFRVGILAGLKTAKELKDQFIAVQKRAVTLLC